MPDTRIYIIIKLCYAHNVIALINICSVEFPKQYMSFWSYLPISLTCVRMTECVQTAC